MLYMILIPVISVLFIGLILLLSKGASSQNKQNAILTALGLSNKQWGGRTAAFYKWSWRKTSKERVWGERNVKDAFKKAKIWLNADDLAYFEQKCVEFQKHHKMNDEPIIERVSQIIKRTEELEKRIESQVKETLNRITSISEGEAKKHLQDSGVNLEGKDKILQRYASHEIRRVADFIGFTMLGRNPNTEALKAVNNIKGMEGWERWLCIYKATLLTEISRSMNSSNTGLLETVSATIRSGLLKDYEQDIQGYRSFIDSMDKQIDPKKMNIRIEKFEELETNLYTWQFSSEHRFNNTDHSRVRQFISRKDLSLKFRLYVMANIKSSFESLTSLLNSLSRNVVFFGKNGFARAYAADQYHLHLERFLEVFSRFAHQEPGAPGLITLTETEIDKKRKEIASKSKGDILKGKGMDVIEIARNSIQETVDKKKARSIDKRKIDEDVAEQKGWLVDFPWEEQNVEVFGIFRSGPFNLYTPVNCDSFGEVDFLSNSANAKRQRNQYFAIVLDALLSASPFTALAENSA